MPKESRRIRRWLAYALAVLLAWPSSAGAQTPAAPAAQPATVRSLKVLPLAGNREMNDLEHRVMAPLVVQVLDQNDQPVDGAEVVFRFPLQGPSATFADHNNAKTFRTNPDGQAAAIGWMANGQVGTFQVQVTATRGNEQGSTSISMTNVTRIKEEAKARGKSWWSSRGAKIAIVAIAAGAAAAVVLVTRNSGSSKPPVITATPGSPTIGAP